jgi:hypothetical protein
MKKWMCYLQIVHHVNFDPRITTHENLEDSQHMSLVDFKTWLCNYLDLGGVPNVSKTN